MSAIRRVFGDRAGPTALGILVPPGQRTVLVVRPRALAWDLVLIPPLSADAPIDRFRDLAHEEADAAAISFCQALEEWNSGGTGRVELAALPEETGYCLFAEVGSYSFLLCPRRPGQPYGPMLFAELGDAERAAAAVAEALHPPTGSVQEVYFNTRHFGR